MQPQHLNDGDPWILAEDIPDIDFQFSQLWLSSFVNDLERTAGRNYSKILSVYRGLSLKFYYGERDSLAFAEHLLHLIVDTPTFGKKINDEIRRLSDVLRSEVQKTDASQLEALSNADFARLYASWDAIHTELYTWGWLPNAVDMFHNNFTNWIRAQLSAKLTEDEVNQAMVLVTVTAEKSVVQQEHESLMQLAILKAQNDSSFEEAIEAHRERYFHLKHLWLGKDGVYDAAYYRAAIEETLSNPKSPEQRLQEEETFLKDQLALRATLLARFAEERDVLEVFEVYAEFAVTKVYRRDVQLLWAYKMDFIFTELSKRLGITFDETRFLLPSEVDRGLTVSLTSEEKVELSRRAESCVYYAEKGIDLVVTGEEAKKLEAQIVEKELGVVSELKGQTACVGLVRGIVRIVNSVADMAKLQRGEILISIATNPDIVPAMKIAGAIVTEQGGITSHAAIVSRELNVPCVIGTKIATKVLKDGDEVEVDATKGIVTILKRA